MTGHILPFDMQAEIMKRLPVRSLIQFRSVSKPWKSLIDSSEFINNYHINRKHPQHHVFVQYHQDDGTNYISIIDDTTFPNQKSSLTIPGPLSLLKEDKALTFPLSLLKEAKALTSVNGLLCFYGEHRDVAGQTKNMAVLWNPTVRKSVGIPIPNALSLPKGRTYIGFGVCPNTSDPKLVRINNIAYERTFDWEVEVYTLSARVWKSVSNIPPAIKSSYLMGVRGQVFVGGFIYLRVLDDIRWHPGITSNLIVSFDLKSDEFGEVCLPDKLVHTYDLNVAKVYESLGLLEYYRDDHDYLSCGVWVMQEGVAKLFTKMFSIKSPNSCWEYRVSELRNNGDVIVENYTCFSLFDDVDYGYPLEVYEPCSGHTNGIGINVKHDSFSVKSYMETLLLLDHSDSIIH